MVSDMVLQKVYLPNISLVFQHTYNNLMLVYYKFIHN